MNDYRHSVLQVVPWVDRDLLARVMTVIDEHGPFSVGTVRRPDLGDGSLPIAPAFFPLVQCSNFHPAGVFIRDPMTLDGCLLGIQLEDGFATFLGRRGGQLALDLLENMYEPDEAHRFASAVFVEAAASELAELVEERESGELLELDAARRWLRDDEQQDIRGDERSGWGGWSFEQAPPSSSPPIERFERAMSEGAVLAAWAFLNSPGWTHAQAHACWARIAPHVHRDLRAIVDEKFASFPVDDGY